MKCEEHPEAKPAQIHEVIICSECLRTKGWKATLLMKVAQNYERGLISIPERDMCERLIRDGFFDQ